MAQVSTKLLSLNDKHIWMDNPHELLSMLEPIMGNTGCLKSSNDVNLLVKVMETSCMLVTQCIVINILKQTKAPSTLECFVNSRGWIILIDWLRIAKELRDYSMIIEIIQILIKFPVNIDNLKQGNIGKIVKQFSKSEFHDVQKIAKRVLLKWKTILKGFQTLTVNTKTPEVHSTISVHSLSSNFDESESTNQSPNILITPSLDPYKNVSKEKFYSKDKDSVLEYGSISRPTKVAKLSLLGKKEKTIPQVKKHSFLSNSLNFESDNNIPISSNNPSANLNESRYSIGRFYGSNISQTKSSSNNRTESNYNNISSKTDCVVQSKKFSEAYLESTSLKKQVKRTSAHTSMLQKAISIFPNPNVDNPDEMTNLPSNSSVNQSDLFVTIIDEPKIHCRNISNNEFDKMLPRKKKVSWAPDEKLTEIRYIEVDDTEINVHSHSSFYDAIQQEKLAERNALARIFANDRMLGLVEWEHPCKIDIPDPLVIYGSKSVEKEKQLTRERSVLALLFLNKECAPDDPLEPDLEDVQIFREPKIIPHYEPGKEISHDSLQPQSCSTQEIINSATFTISSVIGQPDQLSQLNQHSVLSPFCPLPIHSLNPTLSSNNIPDLSPAFYPHYNNPHIQSVLNITSPTQENKEANNFGREKIQEFISENTSLQRISSQRNTAFKKSKYSRGRGRNAKYCQHFIRGFCKKGQNCHFTH